MQSSTMRTPRLQVVFLHCPTICKPWQGHLTEGHTNTPPQQVTLTEKPSNSLWFLHMHHSSVLYLWRQDRTFHVDSIA